MSTAFQLPEWFPVTEPTPSPPVDDHRIEALVNRFIAGKQEALFLAPDAFYRRSGGDAVDGAPATVQRLNDLRSAILEQARDDGERAALSPRLDLHIDDANGGIDRHVAEQRRVHQRQILSERQSLIRRAAELEYDNDDKIAGLAEANASAASELARMDGQPDGPAISEARSAVWRTAIHQRIASAKVPEAIALFDRVRNQLAPAGLLSLDALMQAARYDQAADQWIAGQIGTDGPPLQQRVDSDANLSPEAKAIVRAKVDARESASESARVARVQTLDDEARAAMYDQAVNPRAYRPGTFARLADAYDAAGAPESAAFARRLATYDAFIASFAQSSAEKQQGMIDALPEEWRPIAGIVQDHQAAVFGQDAFAAGTTIYDEVGQPVPIDDIQGRIRQARQIAQLRGGIPVMPFTVDEMQRGQGKWSDYPRNGTLDETPLASNGGGSSAGVGAIDLEGLPPTVDPNVIWAAGDDKRPPLRGSFNRRRTWSDSEGPEPKQIDPLAGGGGGALKLPSFRRPATRSGPAGSGGSRSSGFERKEPSPEERQRQLKQFDENKANGRAWESKKRPRRKPKVLRSARKSLFRRPVVEEGEWTS